MLTGLCLSLIVLHHRVKSGYPVRKKKKCVDSPDGLGCPRLLPVGDHPQQRLQRNAVTDCSLHIVSEMEHTAKRVFPRHSNDSVDHISPARCVVLSPMA